MRQHIKRSCRAQTHALLSLLPQLFFEWCYLWQILVGIYIELGVVELWRIQLLLLGLLLREMADVLVSAHAFPTRLLEVVCQLRLSVEKASHDRLRTRFQLLFLRLISAIVVVEGTLRLQLKRRSSGVKHLMVLLNGIPRGLLSIHFLSGRFVE